MAPFLLPAFLFCGASRAVADSAYSDTVSKRAVELRLADEREWLHLIHYQPHWIFPGYYSLVDDPDFFLSPKGKDDPEAELQATIAAFFLPPPTDPETEHPQCRFPARYAWLKEKLGFQAAQLPEQPCQRFQEWRDALDPGSISLIFPANYLNNPASMFGHTLLRIDGNSQDAKTRLLAYGASYAAGTEERSGIVFSLRAIIGDYHGVFTLAPYYKQVKQYNDLEHRDIWEYKLDFNAEEREQLVRHLWELGHTYFDYYFFDENCAYHLLSLFEVARPTLELSKDFRFWAIPSDTLQSVAEVPGFITDSAYRPAASTIIQQRAEALPKASQQKALAIAEGDDPEKILEGTDDVERARILELVYDYLSYRILRTEESQPELEKRAQQMLVLRSKVKTSVPAFQPKAPAVRPDQGHRTSRMQLGGGVENGRGFAEIGIRPAYHELRDSSGGYVSGAELRFLDTVARIDEDNEIKLEEIWPLRLVSLSPRSIFLRPWSWNFEVGMRREYVREGDDKHSVGQTGFGMGQSYALGHSTVAYGLLDGAMRFSGQLDDGFALGGGPKFGVVADLSDSLRVLADVKVRRFLLGDNFTEFDAGIDPVYFLSRDMALRGSFRRQAEAGVYFNHLGVALQFYF